MLEKKGWRGAQRGVLKEDQVYKSGKWTKKEEEAYNNTLLIFPSIYKLKNKILYH